MKSKLFKTAAITATAAGVTALGLAVKKKKISPNSYAKQAVNATKLTFPVDETYDNGVALTPPMGWSSWNTFRNRIDENLIYEVGQAMQQAGLVEAGYQYVNIDDCWQSSMRDENGRLQGDFVNFPSGIKALSEKINALGMKLGIYTSNGTLTCEDLPASLGYEAIDADTFAEWGVEYFKYDFCHNVPIPSRAPCIEKITVSLPGEAHEKIYYASEAVLTGEAHVVQDDKLDSGEYIGGLSGNTGSAEFQEITVGEDAEYILTLCIRKKSHANKYLEVQVNGDKVYSTIVPPTRAFSASGRHQMRIHLQAGTNSIRIYNPVGSRQDSTAMQYTQMGKELKRATKEYAEKTGQPEKKIVYSICEWGVNLPWRWGKKAGNLWRTTPDIKAFWASIVGIYEVNVKLHKHAGPGSWNDPDMLEVGNGSLTEEENKAHFTLWCMMAAPLILGNDVRRLVRADGTPDTDNKTLQIITNKDLIAIDQDALGMQCRRISTSGVADTLVKPLENGDFAICFFNKGSEARDFEQTINGILCQEYIHMPYTDNYEIVDLWTKETQTVTSAIRASVPGHGVKVFRVRAV